MGNQDSKTQSPTQQGGVWQDYLAEVESSLKSDILPFYKSQISYIEKLFRQLDKTNTKSLELSEMKNVPALSQHPFREQFMTLFEEELIKIKTKKISLQIFLHLLSTFHIHTELQQKAKFLFRAYDWDKDFKLNHSDLVLTFRLIFKEKLLYDKLLNEDMIKNMASEALFKYGTRGEIRLEQFIELIPHDQIQQFMTFKFAKSFQ